MCLARGVNIGKGVKSVFANNTNNIDSCIYKLTDGTRGKSSTFNKYNEWIYPSNFEYPMPKAFMWYPYPELSESTFNEWKDR